MANETGIYKLKDGGWGFRYTISVCGKRKDVKRVRDAYGNPMKTKRDAVLARAEAMKAEEIPQQIRIVRKSPFYSKIISSTRHCLVDVRGMKSPPTPCACARVAGFVSLFIVI